MLSESEIKEKVRSFLLQYVQIPGLRDEEDYFASRLVNSMFAMQLVLFVEKEFGIKVESGDLDIQNFRSINAVAGLVVRKSATGVS